MDARRPYTISFKSLKEGMHTYDFRVQEAFFKSFESEHGRDADITCHVTLDRKSSMLALEVTFSGSASFDCDRCMEPCTIDLAGEHTLFYKFGEGDDDADEDVYFVGAQETEIDISRPLYEYIALAVPARKVHDEGDCDPDVIDALFKGEPETEGPEETDPRWDALKKLK